MTIESLMSKSFVPNAEGKNKKERIFLSLPYLGAEAYDHVRKALASGWIAPGGPFVEQFEQMLVSITGFKYALATVSCTAALHLAFRVVGVGPGDEVWCPTLTFLASVAPALELGATPRLLDVTPDTWTLDTDLLADQLHLASKRGRLPKVVVTTDLYGYPADIKQIVEICSKFDVFVLSDSAAALGSRVSGCHAGFGAQIACISFNGNKIVTTGGGGALLSDNLQAITMARRLAAQAREPCIEYVHRTFGYAYRLSNVSAAVGLAQLHELDERIELRRKIFNTYFNAFSSTELGGFLPQFEKPGVVANRWLSVFRLDDRWQGVDISILCKLSNQQGIEIRPAWRPLHCQPTLSGAPRVGGQRAEAIARRGFCLPSGRDISSQKQQSVISFISEYLGRQR